MLKDLKPYYVIELMRTYEFPNKESVTLCNVREIIVTKSTHRLKTLDGQKHIVPKGWKHIIIDSEHDWVF